MQMMAGERESKAAHRAAVSLSPYPPVLHHPQSPRERVSWFWRTRHTTTYHGSTQYLPVGYGANPVTYLAVAVS